MTDKPTPKTFIIAELSANHNNDFDLAVRTIEEMARSGADAVKVQTYKPESLTLNTENEFFARKTDGLWKGYTPWELYTEASMPYEWQPKLKKITEDLGLQFFSSPFDKEGVDFLHQMDVPMYKIASFEITDIPLIRYAASKGRPLIISTGVATKEDIGLALEACHEAGNEEVALLKCTSQYPARIEDANLITMVDLAQSFEVRVGVSDHTMGSHVPVMAVALGGSIVEKHFILDRALGGPDAAFSMNPAEFKKMADDVRLAEQSKGNVTYKVADGDKMRRRSLFAAADIKQGDQFTELNVRSVRPGHGLHPANADRLYQSRAVKDIPFGSPITREVIDFEPEF